MSVRETVKAKPDGLLARAYALAKKAHAGQLRATGEPYFIHPLAVAEKLTEWQMDTATVAAGLLHDVVEDTNVSLPDIRLEFGEEIAFLVNGVTKIGRIKYRGAQAQVENLRKLIFSLSEDLRVVFIKLADRLHNMQTLAALPSHKQKRIALETDEVYAPLAVRVGMQNLSGELHDLAFPYLYPKESHWLKEALTEEYGERLKYLQTMEPVVRTVLKEQGIAPRAIDFRAKRAYSLYQKLLHNGMDIERVHDLVAMRIIVQSTEECYATLGVIHQHWLPLPGRIKDYIAMPKPNGYRSLHTTIIGPGKKIVEFQIRTTEMHEENESGLAAHWFYKQRQIVNGKLPILSEEMQWIKELRAWREYDRVAGNPEEFLRAMKIDFFKDRVFAITPRGDVVDLPLGATPVDFAYQVHTDIGNACVGAKVNNQFVPLDYELRSGDCVEILTQKNKRPSADWLKFVKTTNARDHIRNALRRRSSLSLTAVSKTELRIVTADRPGIVKDISNIITRSHVNILHFNSIVSPGNNFPVTKVVCATADKHKIEQIVLKIKKIKEVKEISYRIV